MPNGDDDDVLSEDEWLGGSPFDAHWKYEYHSNSNGDGDGPRLHKSFLSIDQLYKLPKEPIAWVVDRLFRVKGFSMLYGFSGDGKSAFARYLMACIVLGIDFLGFKIVKRGPVLYLCAEDMVEDLDIYFRGLGLVAGDPLYTFPDTAFEVLSSALPERIRFLEDQLKAMRGNVSAVFVDTYWDFSPMPQVNDYVAKAFLMPLKTLARKYDVQIFGSHHSIKNASDPKMAFQGNVSIMGCFDTGLYIDRGPKTTTLQLTKVRSPFGQPFDKLHLVFDPKTYRFSSGGAATTEESSDKDAFVRARMVGYLKENPYAKYKEMIASSGIGAGETTKLLKYLTTIVPVQVIRYGNENKGYFYVRSEDEQKPPTGAPPHIYEEWIAKGKA